MWKYFTIHYMPKFGMLKKWENQGKCQRRKQTKAWQHYVTHYKQWNYTIQTDQKKGGKVIGYNTNKKWILGAK